MRILRFVVGTWIGLGVIVTAVRILPKMFADGMGAAFFARLGITVLFAAFSIWLIVGALKRRPTKVTKTGETA